MKLLNKKTIITAAAALMFAFVAVFVPVTPANAQTCEENNFTIGNGVNCGQGEGTPTTLIGSDGSIFNTVVNVLLFVIGAISVIMLIWGGIRYTTSAGNSSSVTAAKNTILYAIIGLVFAFLAYAIVNWVLVAINPTS